MSKTLGNVIDARDLVVKYATDATRYLVFTAFGFGNDRDTEPLFLALYPWCTRAVIKNNYELSDYSRCSALGN